MHDDIINLRWATTSDPFVNNVRFEHRNCSHDDEIAGSIYYAPSFGSWRNVGSSSVARNVNYLENATICIDSDTNFKSTDKYNGRVNAIAHEIGHVYGLTDRYFDNKKENKDRVGECNDNEVTIMDAYNCDGIDKPQVKPDIARVKSLYSDGSLQNFIVTPSATTSATSTMVSWEDHSWAEKEHRIKYYIYDEHGGWQMFGMKKIMDGIHAHRNMLGIQSGHKPYELSFDFDPEKFIWMNPHKKLPNIAAYRFCGAPYFLPFNKEASINTLNSCSKPVWLVIPNGEFVASSSNIKVNDTQTVHLSGLVPNDINEFTVKVSGSISVRDECANADEYVRGVASFVIYGCAAGKGTLTLQTRRYALTIAELNIEVEPDPENLLLIDGVKRADSNDPAIIRYGDTTTVSVANLAPNTPDSFMLRIPNLFARSTAACALRQTTDDDNPWWAMQLPKSKSVVLKACDSGIGATFQLGRKTESGVHWKHIAYATVSSAPYDLQAEADYDSVTLTWKTLPDTKITAQWVQRTGTSKSWGFPSKVATNQNFHAVSAHGHAGSLS